MNIWHITAKYHEKNYAKYVSLMVKGCEGNTYCGRKAAVTHKGGIIYMGIGLCSYCDIIIIKDIKNIFLKSDLW